jgi:hypothetical protein
MGVVELVCVEEARSGEGCVFSVYNKGIWGVFQVVCRWCVEGGGGGAKEEVEWLVSMGCLACGVHCSSAPSAVCVVLSWAVGSLSWLA